MMKYVLNEENFKQIEGILKALRTKAEAKGVFLADRGGNLIAQTSVQAFPLEDNLAALVAGSFFASHQAATILGESDFYSMCERGKNISIFVRCLLDDHLIIVFFGAETNQGIVKLFAEDAAQAMNTLLEALQNPDSAAANQFVIEPETSSHPVFTT